MAELDRSRPFDRVWGIVGEGEPYFFQDGKAFDSNGTEIAPKTAVEELVPDAVAEEPKKKSRKKAADETAVEPTDENHDLL